MAIPSLDEPILRHARTDLIPFRVGQTVGEALAQIRARPPAGRVVYFYVVDDQNRLRGVVPTRRLLLSALETKIEDIMIRQVRTIAAGATVLDACELFTMHKLLALPVVDSDRRYLGVVDIELYTDEILDLSYKSSYDDVFQLIGFHLTEARRGTPLHAFRVRFPWLTCNLVGGVLAALLCGAFQDVLDRNLVLALFIPAVLSLSESVGIQSVSLALDALHVGRAMDKTTALATTRRELATGAFLGLACGLILGLVAWVWNGRAAVALSLLASIALAVTSAALVGITLPFALRLLRQDPRVAAGPIALVSADLLTLAIYFTLANRLLS
jgi:magnesium transporter